MKNFLRNARLYLILDTEVGSYEKLFEILEKVSGGFVDIIQLRDKNGTGRSIIDFSKRAVQILRHRIPFIVNDRADCAAAGHADGVHLGQEDLPVPVARKILGTKAIIGLSCQTLAHARAAQMEGADYIGFGSVFPTVTKPERRGMDLNLLSRVKKKVSIPLFAVGGISLDNVGAVLSLGVSRVAVNRGICLAPDVRKAAWEFQERLRG